MILLRENFEYKNREKGYTEEFKNTVGSHNYSLSSSLSSDLKRGFNALWIFLCNLFGAS